MPRPQVKLSALNLPPEIAPDASPHAPGSQPLGLRGSPQSELPLRKQALPVELPDAVSRVMRQASAYYNCQLPSHATAEASDRRPSPVLLTIEEVAALLRISTKSVRRRIKSGLIRKAALGGRTVRISPDEVQRLTAGTPPEDASEDVDLSQY
jgi:excisionase family DNA binding protein